MSQHLANTPLSLDDEDGLSSLSSLIEDWEPHLRLVRPDRRAVLYDPDGTIYGVALSDGMTFRTDRRNVPIRAGDAVVLPAAFAIDAGPVVDLVALRYDGPPPDHFRERFLQVWGFEHLPCPGPSGAAGSVHEVIPADEVRHRVPYGRVVVRPGSVAGWVRSEELTLIVGLDGRTSVEVDAGETMTRLDVLARQGVVVGPAVRWRASGAGTLGALSVLNEISHAARRAGAARPPSAEYRPPGDV